MPAARVQIAHELLIHPHKNRICIHGENDVDLGLVSQAISEMSRRAIRVLCIL
jgi:hypothetical protein